MAKAIARCPAVAREVLETVALLHGPFAVATASAILDKSVRATRAALDALVDRSLLARVGELYEVFAPAREALAQLTDERARRRATLRSDLHLLEQAQRERDRLTPLDVDALLTAAERGLAPRDKLVAAIPPWSLRAQHVAPLRRLIDGGLRPSVALDLELALLEGATERAARLAEEALIRRTGEHALELELRIAYALRRFGQHERARALLEPVIDRAPPALRARALNERAAGLYLDGRAREAIRSLDEAAQSATRLELTALRGAIATNLSNALADLGALDEATRVAEAAFGLALDERGRALALASLARLALERGASQEAARAIAEVRHAAIASSHAELRSFLRRLDAWCAHQRGDDEEAMRSFDEAASIAHAAGAQHAFERSRIEHAFCAFARDPARARRLARGLADPLARSLVAAAERVLSHGAVEATTLTGPCPSREALGSRETIDERCTRLLSLFHSETPLDDALDALWLAERSAMTRAVVDALYAHEPARLAFVAFGDRQALVGAKPIDLRKAPVLASVLVAIASAHPEGLDAAHLLANAWPEQKLSPQRAVHRAHGRVRELRALGVPISLEDGRYRLTSPPIIVPRWSREPPLPAPR